jgi:hypothetical protein
LSLSTFQRRRIAVLGLATVILFPLLRSCGGGDPSDSGNTAVTNNPASVTTILSSNSITEDESPVPIILSGPAPIVQDGSALIAYPEVDIGGTLIATFSNFNNAPEIVCFVPTAPYGITLRVTNINNGRTTTCTNVYQTSLPAGVTVLLHTKVFERISNLVDAPIPVNVSTSP